MGGMDDADSPVGALQKTKLFAAVGPLHRHGANAACGACRAGNRRTMTWSTGDHRDRR